MKNKLAVLGPEYSYCHILALKIFPDSSLIFCSNIPEIFNKVAKNEAESGLAPMENLLHGTVRESIFSLQKKKIKINAAFDLPIHHCLASKSKDFKKIISKAEALSQCSLFLKKENKQTEEISSTSKAMELASKDEDYAAIGSEESAVYNKLNILKKNI